MALQLLSLYYGQVSLYFACFLSYPVSLAEQTNIRETYGSVFCYVLHITHSSLFIPPEF